MAKKSIVERNKKRERMVEQYRAKRLELKSIMQDKSKSTSEIFKASTKLAKLPRNSAANRVRNRCFITGRGRGYYRSFGISRIMIRELGLQGYIPGLTKSSW